MPTKRPSKTAAPDWTAIEADYRTGEPVRAIAARHRLSPSTIYRRARKLGWRRLDPAGSVADSVAAAPAGGADPPRAEAAGELDRLRSLAAKLNDRLERLIEGDTGEDAVLGGRDSPATLLLKLCQITEKILAIERRVAGTEMPGAAQLDEQDREILDRFKRRVRAR